MCFRVGVFSFRGGYSFEVGMGFGMWFLYFYVRWLGIYWVGGFGGGCVLRVSGVDRGIRDDLRS